MLTEQQVAAFDRDGFLLGRQMLNDEQVERLRQEIDRVICEKDKPGVAQPVCLVNLSENDKKPVWQIVNIYQASEPFGELIHYSQIVEEIAQLIRAKQLRIWHDQIQYKPAEIGGILNWHQDSPYWPVLQPKHEQVSAWVALDDVDKSNGCMSMVPGSHHWADQIDYLEDRLADFHHPPAQFNGHQVHVVQRPVRKGYVHYHHALTWHGSPANTSGRPRRAIALHYMNERTCYDARGDHLMKQFITVENNAPLTGDHFPLVWPTAEQPETGRNLI